MQKMMDWLENSFAPKMNKINSNVWILTLKDSISQVLPFILLGSLFCVLGCLEDWVSFPFSFWDLNDWTIGMLSILISFLIPFNFCEKKRLRKQRLIAGCTGLIVFLISVSPEIISEGVVGFSFSGYGAGGMFCSIATGIITCIIFNLFGNFSFFKKDSAIPDFVRQWFDSLLPIGLLVIVFYFLTTLANLNIYQIITNLLMPLGNLLNTWYGFILINFLNCFIYSMGISGWVLSPIEGPVKLSSIAANMALVAAGTATAANLNVCTEAFIYATYLWWGGIGCTFPLVILLCFAKSKKLKSLGKACLVPSIMNINEPVVFGCVAWNPLLMIPMWIIGIVLPALSWIACKVLAIFPIPVIQFDIWYCPLPISTFLATQGSVLAIVLAVLLMLVAALIWYPFFKVYDKQCVKEEADGVK